MFPQQRAAAVPLPILFDVLQPLYKTETLWKSVLEQAQAAVVHKADI